jgi:RNA polymerase sigma-70 factor (ECF subfamily)
MNAVLIRPGAVMACDPHADLSALLPRLVAFARTIVGDREVARDLVQEAAARALGARQVPAEGPAYRAWMFRIVRNAALDELRRRRRQEPVPRSDREIDLFGFDAARIAKLTVEQGLAAIEPAHREIIALIDIAGFSYAEAARLIGVPIGTVMSRLARARTALLAAIERSTVRTLRARHGG